MVQRKAIVDSIKLLESGIANSMTIISQLRDTENPKLSPEMIANLMLQTTMNTTAIMDGIRAILILERDKGK